MINAWRVARSKQHTNILSVSSLQSLKKKFSNEIVLGPIVAAFKKAIGFELNNALIFWRCVALAMLGLSSC